MGAGPAGRPAPIRSCALLRTWASLAATPKPGAFRNRAAVTATAAGMPCHPAGKNAATAPHTARSSARGSPSFILTIFRPRNARLHPTQETRNWIRNTRTKRESYLRGRNRKGRHCSAGRNRIISTWGTRRPMQRECKNWNRGTSNRPCDFNKGTTWSGRGCKPGCRRLPCLSPSLLHGILRAHIEGVQRVFSLDLLTGSAEGGAICAPAGLLQGRKAKRKSL